MIQKNKKIMNKLKNLLLLILIASLFSSCYVYGGYGWHWGWPGPRGPHRHWHHQYWHHYRSRR